AEVEEAVAGKYKYCQGYNGIQCSFGAEGRPAQPHGPARCLFCNPEHLQEALNAPLRAAAARRRFAQLSPEAQEAVLGRVVRPEHRDQLAAAQPLLEAEEPAPRAYRRQDQSWRGAAPYTPEDLAARYSAGAAAWEEVLRQRQAVAEPEVAAVEYRVKVVDDRRKSLNMMQQAEPRLPRGAEVSNEDIVAKAAATRLAANLQLWAEFNSWQVCDSCGALQPRDLSPAGLRGLLRPHCDARHCIFCRSARPAPRPQPPPDALRSLSLDVRQALQPAEPDFGRRLQAARAYADFYWEHESFLANNAGCDARARRRWLRFMEKEGLECALWPDLFLERQHCLTWARLQSSSRQARGSERSTLEERLNFDPLGEASPPEEATGPKRSYMALVLSPILDFSLSYELLHFAFDLGLWTDLGAKRNLNLGTPLRLLLKGHSFSSEYWRDMHRALVDLTRQKGYPPIFATHSPLEWSWPNHCHILDAMRKGRRGRDMEALRLERCVQATLEVEPASLRGFVVASQLDGNGKSGLTASRYNSNIRAYEFFHNAEDHSKGVRGYFSPLMEVTKCHQDVQVDQRGQQNYAAYTAKYAPKFSDSMEEELLNDDADANSIAASVLSRYKPCVPEMALQLFGSVFRQWHIGTRSGGRRALNVPTPDVDPAPKVVELYENSAWRADNMTLLDYLRKTNDQGEIAGWLKAQWRSAGQPDTLQNFANAYRPQGEKVVACGVGSRLRDKFYGQRLLLNVPFRTRSALLLPEVAERVPPADRWLATCVFCPQAEARQVWDSEAAVEEDMLLEGHGRLHRQEVLGYFRAQSALVRQYMSGALQKPAPRPAVTRPGRTHFLPIQNRYAELIATGAKTVEVAALVKAGDRLRLGPVHCKVTEINNYTSFEEMLRSTPWQAAVPDVSTLQEALEVYHSFANYEDLAQRCGVLAFHVQLEETNPEAPAWNAEQGRWLRLMEEDLARAAAVHFASTEAEADAARAKTWQCNRIRALEGPPGTGKTTVAKELVEQAVGQGLRVLWTVYTAQLASRMRQEFGGGVDVDTCHAALGLDQEIAECGLNLACYDLVILDEFSQLEARHFAHAVHLHDAVDKTPAFGLLGDRRQMAGYGTERPWHSPLWRAAVHQTQLHVLFRCKDEKFRRVLGALRTAKPTATGPRGSVSVADIVRGRRAWRGGQPRTADIARLLRDHSDTTLLAITRRGAATFNNLAVQAIFSGRRPVATLDADVESNPENYTATGQLKPAKDLIPTRLAVFEGMAIYTTLNVDKARDFVNGMKAFVESYDRAACALIAVAVTAGYGNTVLKVAGAELPHVVLWLDVANIPGAAYTGMSRVARG
ncbi:unnamed protein product, partial [Effrenium voratum]